MNKHHRLSFQKKRVISWLICLFLFTAFFIASLFILSAISEPGYDPVLIYLLIIFVIIALVSSIVLGLEFLFYSLLFIQKEIMYAFFLGDAPVFNDRIFKIKVKRFMRKKGAKGAMVRINVRGLNGDILNNYGTKTLQSINQIILETIKKRCHHSRLYAYTFTPLDGFILYKRTLAASQFHEELMEMAKEIEERVTSETSLSSLTLLYGITWYDEKNLTPDELIARAVLASSYSLQTRLTSDFIEYSASIIGQVDAKKRLGEELSSALHRQELVIYYQAKFNLHNNCFYGAESLIRWNHPERGLLPPSFFIPFAERTGFILDIDRYVFEHVCQDLARWKKEGQRPLIISINLSRKTIYDPNILSYYQEKIEQYGIDPSLIDIELTESLAAKDSVFIKSMLKKISALGFRTSIDDFGIGHSSLSSLKSLPFDTLKIDKSFIDDIEVTEESRAIVSSIVSLAHLLHMKTIAEGVESEGQVNLLRSLNVDAVQGYYYSKPVNEYDFMRLLANNRFEENNEIKEEEA